MNNSITLDELLEQQNTLPLLATIEIVEDKTDVVKITPWVKHSGCQCQFALQIAKSAIESVAPTGDLHICCGKALKVVVVEFKNDSTISLNDLYGQLAQSNTRQEQSPPFESRGVLQTQGMPPMEFPNLLSSFSAAQFCTPPSVPLNCPGTGSVCVAPGSFCCGFGFCGPNQMCLNCPGTGTTCVKPGSFCCGFGYCDPGLRCVNGRCVV